MPNKLVYFVCVCVCDPTLIFACTLLAPDTISMLLSGAHCLHELLRDAPLLCLKRERGQH